MRCGRWIALAVLVCAPVSAEDAPVYMADGIKIGEVTPDSAIVWTRLTASPERNTAGFPFPDVGNPKDAGASLTTAELTGGHALDEMEGSVPGARGLVRVVYWPEAKPEKQAATEWAE
ncbi:MAG: alkaline phosphatase, partial [Candidatus Hydrogenedentes bacterium]|nr:alkaline phosphatase [Candidatus Hydrogenedentota bacterium]